MEIDITEFVKLGDMKYCSGSCMEFGDDAARITWKNTMDRSEDFAYVTEDNKQDFLDYFDDFGAWEMEEMNRWSLQETQALFLQMIAGDMREFSDSPIEDWDWDDYQAQCEDGIIHGRIGKGDDGR